MSKRNSMSLFTKLSVLFALLFGGLNVSAQATYNYHIQQNRSCNSITFSYSSNDPNLSTVKWDFGDGAALVEGSEVTHIYADNADASNLTPDIYTVRLLDAGNSDAELSSEEIYVYSNYRYASADILYMPERKGLSQSGHNFRVDIRNFYEEGSIVGNYRYDWTVKDASGSVVYTESVLDKIKNVLPIPDEGDHTLEVSVWDNRTNCVVQTLTESIEVTGYSVGNVDLSSSCGYYPFGYHSMPVLDNATNNRKYNVHWDMGDGSTVWEKDFPHGTWHHQFTSVGVKELKAYSSTGELLVKAKIDVDDIHTLMPGTDWSWNIDGTTNELSLSVDGVSSSSFIDYSWVLLPSNIGVSGNTVEAPETDAVYDLTSSGQSYGRKATALSVRLGMGSEHPITCGYTGKDIDYIPLVECDFESTCTPGVFDQISLSEVENYHVYRYLKNTISACGEWVALAEFKSGEEVLQTYGGYNQEEGEDEKAYHWVYVPNTETNPVIAYKEIYQATADRAACYIQRQFPELCIPEIMVNQACRGVSLSYTSDCPVSDLNWVFGDGSTSTEDSPTHTYPESATTTDYTIELRDGTTVLATQVVTIPGALDAGLVWQQNAECKPNGNTGPWRIDFTLYNTNADYLYTISLAKEGEAEVILPEGQLYADVTSQGDYTVKLTISDPASGCEKVLEEVVKVYSNNILVEGANMGAHCMEYSFHWQYYTNGLITLENPTWSIVRLDAAGNELQTIDWGDGLLSSYDFTPRADKPGLGNGRYHVYIRDGEEMCQYGMWDIKVGDLTDLDFTAEETCQNGVEVSVVDYYGWDASWGHTAPHNYELDFGDGTVITGQDVKALNAHGYAQGGTYTITLKASSYGTCENEVSKTITVTGDVYPDELGVCNFSFNPAGWSTSIEQIDGQVKLSLEFNDMVTSFYDVSVYAVEFDGRTYIPSAGNMSITVDYEACKLYEPVFKVKVLDRANCTGCLIDLPGSLSLEPSSVISIVTAENCEEVTLSYERTCGPGVITPMWFLLDNGTETLLSTEASFTHNFGGVGSYAIELRDGSTPGFTPISKTVEVTALRPEAKTFSSEVSCGNAFTVSVDNPSADQSYSWTIGDLTVPGQTTMLPFTTQGNHEITLRTISTATGCSAVHTGSAFADNGPLYSIGYEVGACGAVNFTVESNCVAGSIAPVWSFGDGSSGSGYAVSHTYTRNGTYTVTLSDENGTFYYPDFVQVMISDLPSASSSTSSGCDADLDYSVSDVQVGYNYTWDFGDGSQSTDPNGTHTYASFGSYEVSLSVEHAGCTVVYAHTVQVGPVEATFTLTEEQCSDGEIAPRDVPVSGVTGYAWTFGDLPEVYTERYPEVLYPLGVDESSKVVPVKLTVYSENNGESCVSEQTKQVTLYHPVNAEFTLEALDNQGHVKLSALDPEHTSSYTATFEEGAVHTGVSPTTEIHHTFTSTGVKTVRLEVSNGPCLAVYSIERLIHVPEVHIESDPEDYICGSGSVTLEAVLSGHDEGLTYHYRWLRGLDIVGGDSKAVTVSEGGSYGLQVFTDGPNPIGLYTYKVVEIYPLPDGLTASNIVGESCAGLADGSCSISIPNYLSTAGYTVNGGEVQNDATLNLTGLSSGVKYYRIAYANRPECSVVVEVDVPFTGPSVSTSMEWATCGHPTGALEASVSGGETPYSYAWYRSGDLTTSLGSGARLENQLPGTYTLVVTDNSGCEVRKEHLRIKSSELISRLATTDLSTCSNGGAVTVEPLVHYSHAPEEEVTGLTYSWKQDGLVVSTDEQPSLPPGKYTLEVHDPVKDCYGEYSFEVASLNPLIVEITQEDIYCIGDQAELMAISKGGSGVYSYAWTGTSVNGPRFKGAEADQTYEVTVSDDHGCVTSVSRTVVYVAPPLSDVSVEMDHCEVSMTVTGGHAPYNFKWYQQLPIERVEDRTPPFDSEGNPQEDVLDFEALEKVITIEKVLMHEHGGLSTSELMSGTYELVVTDAEGCTHVLENVEIIREEDETFPDFSFVFTGIEPDSTPDPTPQYDEFIVSKLAEAKQSMSRQLDKCLSNAEYNLTTYLMQNCFDVDQFSDELTVTHDFDAHHYTLYYYDRAGKLTQTVPPEGVDLLSLEEIGAIQTYREDPNNTAPSKLYPAHSLNTKYDYNSLGQLVHQETPDGGSSYFHYDVHNRLRFSQNAEQARTGKFSYVKYDELGRTIEAGESSQTGLVFGEDLSLEAKEMNATLSNTVSYPQVDKEEITQTVYTVPASVTYGERTQRHLQNRISHVYKDEDGNLSTTEDQHYSYYSYDAHGNVEWLVQEDPVLGRNSVEYVYDLVNGNVLEVAYNKYRNDKFYHRYRYDANNRLLSVLTSRDGEVWDEDVRQEYYRHGPMKRMEIGEDEIQGMDYVYTIQGWMKALNAPDLDPLHDPGSDGTGNSIQDVFGMSLNYFAGDYKSGTSFLSGVDDFNPAEVKSLYSGNIAKWSSRTLTGEEGTDQLTARTFGYDHLNRIKSSAYHEYNATAQSWAGGSDKYRTEYAYDANGNLETLKRYDQNAALMDELHYLYKGQNSMSDPKTGNQLMSVTDVTEESYTKVDGQGDLMGTHVYEYDAIGNLIKDTGKEWLKNNTTGNYEAHDVVLDIKWNVSGKVEEVAKTITNSSGVREELIRFHYDAMGNRVSKEVNHDVSIAEVDTKTTYYVRDASGNPMGVYERRNESLENDPEGYAYEAVFELVEHSIYGGSRVGLDQERKEVYRQKYTVSEEVALPRQLDGLHRQQSLNTLYAASNRSTGVNGGVIADASLHQITTDEAGVDQVTLQQNILGRVSEGVAVVENSEGELLFTAVLAGSYLGSQDACLIYDKTGQLMQGVELIGSQSAQVKPIAVKLGGANRYALVTLNDQNKPVYHVIDMDATGYGSAEDKRGAVVQANTVITEEAGVYGKHLTGIEDGIGEQSVLYQTRYVAPSSETEIGKTEVLAYVFDEAGGVEVERMAAFGSRDSRGEGELQLGANGTELVYYNRKDYIGGFAYQKGMLHVMHLGSDKSSIEGKPLQLTTGEGGTIGTGHVSFKEDGKGLYYSQRSLYKAGSEQGYAKLWDYELLTASIFPVEEGEAHLYGSVRQNGSGEYYILRSTAPAMEVDKLSEDGTLSALAAGTSSTAYSWASSLPGEVYKVQPEDTQLNYQRISGSKSYELKDHLGNVRAVVSDKRFAVIENNTLNNTADLLSYSDIYPFGMEMPGRSMSGEYRYGFNGAEKDDELKGSGNSYDLGLRMYNTRTGRMFSRDPRESEYPWQSTYAYYKNSPIATIDFMGGGADDWVKIDGQWKWDKDVKSEADAVAKYGEGVEYGRIGKIYKAADDRYVELGENGNWSYVEAKDHAEEMILKGSYRYTANYGWVDYNHAFKGDGAALLIKDVFNQGVSTRYGGDQYRYVSYEQMQHKVAFGRKIVGVGIKDVFKVPNDQNMLQLTRISLYIFNKVSMEFEALQGKGLIGKVSGDSSFEPADLTSNLLAFYNALGLTQEEILGYIKPTDIATSLEIYRMYPTLYHGDGNGNYPYRNYNMFKPMYFPNPYTGDPVYPSAFLFKPLAVEKIK